MWLPYLTLSLSLWLLHSKLSLFLCIVRIIWRYYGATYGTTIFILVWILFFNFNLNGVNILITLLRLFPVRYFNYYYTIFVYLTIFIYFSNNAMPCIFHDFSILFFHKLSYVFVSYPIFWIFSCTFQYLLIFILCLWVYSVLSYLFLPSQPWFDWFCQVCF